MSSTALYRIFDDNGHLLYVGISLNALSRLGQHLGDKAWGTQVATVQVGWHDSRTAAIHAETVAIRNEQPRHNILHNERVLALAALRGQTEHPAALAALNREQLRLAGRSRW